MIFYKLLTRILTQRTLCVRIRVMLFYLILFYRIYKISYHPSRDDSRSWKNNRSYDIVMGNRDRHSVQTLRRKGRKVLYLFSFLL